MKIDAWHRRKGCASEDFFEAVTTICAQMPSRARWSVLGDVSCLHANLGMPARPGCLLATVLFLFCPLELSLKNFSQTEAQTCNDKFSSKKFDLELDCI